MLTPELKDYLKGLKKTQPVPAEAEVMGSLSSVGWNQADIGEAIEFYRNAGAQTVSISDIRTKPISMEKAVSTFTGVGTLAIGASVTDTKNQTPSFAETDRFANRQPEQFNPRSQSTVDISSRSERAQESFSMRTMADSAAPHADVFQRNSDISLKKPIVGFNAPKTQIGDPRAAFSATGYSGPVKKKSRGKLVFFIVILLLLAAGAGAVFASYKGWIKLPFSLPFISSGTLPYTEENLLTGLFESISKIESAAYEASAALNMEKRESNAKPFSLEASEADKELKLAYKRDKDRFEALQLVKTGLSSYSLANKGKYPKTLQELSAAVSAGYTRMDFIPKDPSGSDFKYELSGSGDDYKLFITFETDEAVRKISEVGTGNTEVNGKTAIFNKSSATFIYFSGEPPQPILVSIIDANGEMINYLPADLSARFAVSGNFRKDKSTAGNDTGVRFRALFNLDTENFKFDVDGELTAIGGIEGDYYVRLNKFPKSLPIPIDLSSILGEWVKLDLADGSFSPLGVGTLPDIEGEHSKASDKALEINKLALKIADEEKVIKFVNKPVEEKFGDVTVIRYDLFFNKERILPFYQRLFTEIKNKYKDDAESKFISRAILEAEDDVIGMLKSKEFSQVFDYLEKNNVITISVEKSTGWPVQIAVKSRIVPGEKALKLQDKQLKLSLGIKLSDINEKSDIKAPDKYLSQEDATIKVTGMSKEQYRAIKQIANVNRIRSAVTNYQMYTGKYPSSLNELKKKGGELKERVGTTPENSGYGWTASYYKERPFLSQIPKDIFTGKEFEYSVSVDDYKLVYTIVLPAYVEGTYPSVINSDYTGTTRKYYLKYADGKNTADSKILSREAQSAGGVDNDQDFISDSLEKYIGTDLAKTDSDGDGYPDGEELGSYRNPLGPGDLERNYIFSF